MTASRTTGRLRIAVFALLVVATFAAFFVVQRVKREPPDVRKARITPLFSPNGDGRDETAKASFVLERPDTISVRVIDDQGNVVTTLMSNRNAAAHKRLTVTWDGKDSAGKRVPDGIYDYRVNLQDQGRAVLLPRGVRIDTKPPQPRVQRIGRDNEGPDILPRRDGEAVTVRFYNPARSSPTEVLIYRTAPDPQLVWQETLPGGERSFKWDGKAKDGSALPPGTYVVGLRTRDVAGNVGTSFKLPPDPSYGQGLPGHGGVTIRTIGVQPTLEPTIGGSPATFGVDARGRTFAWSVRRVGESEHYRDGRPRTGAEVKIDAPDVDHSGLYLFEAHTRAATTTVPFPVQSVKTQKVLVVLPAVTWQGLNELDDDGDGWPNTLSGGLPVRKERILADGLPEDLVKHVAPLLVYLDREGLRYDLTTDLALAEGVGPRLENHTGVVLAGDTRWLPASTQKSLVSWVRKGGKLATFGVDSLRRQVKLTKTQIVAPTEAAPTDAFGARLGALANEPGTTLTIFKDDIDLFAGDVYGGTGVFADYDQFEPLLSAGSGGEVVASAATDDGRQVIAAEKLGDGLVIRFGLPQLTERLGTPGNETELVRRTWTLLSK
jgi:flagellar hook assembly protein FlgD